MPAREERLSWSGKRMSNQKTIHLNVINSGRCAEYFTVALNIWPSRKIFQSCGRVFSLGLFLGYCSIRRSSKDRQKIAKISPKNNHWFTAICFSFSILFGCRIHKGFSRLVWISATVFQSRDCLLWRFYPEDFGLVAWVFCLRKTFVVPVSWCLVVGRIYWYFSVDFRTNALNIAP